MKKRISVLFLSLCFLVVTLSGCNSSKATNYADLANWAILPEETMKNVDVFLVAPTVDSGSEDRFNMDLSDKKVKDSFLGALNMEVGIYNDTCNVYAPYYRQMTLSGYTETNQKAYVDIAYEDVKKAFINYFETRNQGKPFVLAGFSQGSQLCLKLMEDLFDETKYSEKLVASYLIGWSIDEATIEKSPWIKMAEGEKDTGSVISFNSESVATTTSFVVPEGKKTYAINPLNWKSDSTLASADLNLGACFTDYNGNIKKEIPQLSGAYIDENRGTLKVPDVNVEQYPPVLSLFAPGEYHLYDYQFFYRNLQKNVADRVAAFNLY